MKGSNSLDVSELDVDGGTVVETARSGATSVDAVKEISFHNNRHMIILQH